MLAYPVSLKHLVGTIGLSLFFVISFAQNVEWAAKVEGVSSEFVWKAAPGSYTAQTVLGEPSCFVYGKGVGIAWAPSKQKSDVPEYLHVSFANAIQVRQIIVNELQNSGSLTHITLFDTEGVAHVGYDDPQPKPSPDGLFIYMIPLTPYKVVGLKVEFNTNLVNGFINIDAIGVSSSDTPYKHKLNEVPASLFESDAERLSDNVNTTASELLPVISPDGSTLYFTRQNHPGNLGSDKSKQDIWVSARDSVGGFMTAVNLGEPINNANNNSLCSVTPDGQTALLLNVYHPDGSSSVGMSMTKKGTNGWQFPEEVTIQDFYNRNQYGEYHLNADNKTIVMAIQRDDAIGNKDVYVSFLDDDGKWTVPMNLGAEVNTAEGETSPFLAPDRRTLYFASSGWPGYGGRDLFMSTRLDESWTKWSKPINLGSKINTAGFDAYFVVPASGEYAYFTSNKGDEYKEDIHRIKLPSALRPKPVVLVKGRVLNAKTNEPLGADIIYESYLTGSVMGSAKSDANDGKYQIVLPSGSSYGFLASSKDYASLNENIDLTNLKDYNEITRDLYLFPLEKGQVIRLNNVFFDTDKYNFRKETSFELNRLVSMLKEYANLKIEVSGHTDSTGDDAHNQQLSTNRAKAVYNNLIENNIPSDRISFKGYGESKPVATNSTEAGKQQNRRVEFLILEN